MTRHTPTDPAVQPIGIQSDGIYALRDFMARLRLGRHWMRSARKSGLRVRSYGGRSFVVAADFLTFLQSNGGPQS